jgi:medium-chain acyl-[acyl-carrier-protein] hydrolase
VALRLFCFPYAGAGATVYQDWALPAELCTEVWVPRLPGREARWRQPPLRRVEELLAELSAQLTPLMDLPFAFFGHSMGALLAFELARELRRAGGPAPAHLFLSAHRAPDRAPKRGPLSRLPKPQLVTRLLEMAGDSPTAVRHPELLLLWEPTLRADLEACEEYRFRPAPLLNTRVTCFAAAADSEVDIPDVAAWLLHTTCPGRLVTYPDGHMFLHDRRRELLDEIAYDLVKG